MYDVNIYTQESTLISYKGRLNALFSLCFLGGSPNYISYEAIASANASRLGISYHDRLNKHTTYHRLM